MFFEKGSAEIVGCAGWWETGGLESRFRLHGCSWSGGLEAAACADLDTESFTGDVLIDPWCWVRG